ncbi:AAA family ATPase [Saccharibacillus deserti]|uniref:AAA family ATPase n=1 Tax=Saccharibacillus deserti TaxID=1634444 RepID=UPI0015527446|nr:ATP-binding protein [Saccharibacillus deserti]
MNYFITDIEIEKVRHIEDFKIRLSTDKRKHLLITGRNGSGKTSVLEEIKKQLEGIYSGDSLEFINWRSTKERLEQELEQIKQKIPFTTRDSERIEIERKIKIFEQSIAINKDYLEKYSKISLHFSSISNLVAEAQSGRFILAFFGANRQLSMKIPDAIAKIDFKDAYAPSERAADKFLQYLVYLKTQQAFSMTGGDLAEADRIQGWFDRLQEQLRNLFEDEQLKLEFDSRNLNFVLRLEGKREPFDSTVLSAGHTAYLEIVSELIMRMEKNEVSSYDLQGVVLIDEIETHLHVSLQKKILPFLTALFPKLQFIVTTHSPFVLNSIGDTVICDLENRTVMEDFSAYSYESIVEKYFGAEQYSEEIKQKMNEYIALSEKRELNVQEELALDQLRMYLDSIPYNMAPEVKIKFDQLELDRESEQL